MDGEGRRTPLVAGNWKMNCTPAEARALAEELLPAVSSVPGVDVVLCPPFIDLPAVRDVLAGSRVGLGAQNAYDVDRGAYTGEVSAAMLAGLASYVILGHSERRDYFHETDELVNRKLHAALRHGLLPIVCVGERLEEFEAGATEDVIRRQMRASLAGLDEVGVGRLIVAYEPVWAIGTGKAATPEIAQANAAMIRRDLAGMYGDARARAVRILYGGSVTASNCPGLSCLPDVDGALVGGASLKAAEFAAIVRAWAQRMAEP